MYLQVPNLNRSISADPRNKTAYNRSTSADPRNGTNGLKTNIDLNDPAIQAKIGNRATKVVEKTIGMIRSEYYLVFNWIDVVKVRSYLNQMRNLCFLRISLLFSWGYLKYAKQKNKKNAGFLPYPLKRGQKKMTLYTANWRVLFWLSYTTFLIWPLFRGKGRNPGKNFVGFLGDLKTPKINWPLGGTIYVGILLDKSQSLV